MNSAYGIKIPYGLDRLARQANEMQSWFKRMNISGSQLQKNAEMLRKSSIYFSNPRLKSLMEFNQKINLSNSQTFNQVRELNRLFNSSQWPIASSFLKFNPLFPNDKHVESFEPKIKSKDEDLNSSISKLENIIGAPGEQLTSEQKNNLDEIYFATNAFPDSFSHNLGITDDYLYNDILYSQYQAQIWSNVICSIPELYRKYHEKVVPVLEDITVTVGVISMIVGVLAYILNLFK